MSGVESRIAKLRRIVLCPEAIAVVMAASTMVVYADVADLIGFAPPKWCYLVAHVAMLVLICVKVAETMGRNTRIGRRHANHHLHSVD